MSEKTIKQQFSEIEEFSEFYMLSDLPEKEQAEQTEDNPDCYQFVKWHNSFYPLNEFMSVQIEGKTYGAFTICNTGGLLIELDHNCEGYKLIANY